MNIAVSFTNLGPYHLARLRALADRLAEDGDRLVVYETAGAERRYPWEPERTAEPFRQQTLFPDRVLEEIPRADCIRAMRRALDRDRPDLVAIVGYVRPECLAMLSWAKANDRPVLLLSETQSIDRPKVWWKEAVKRRRVSRCDAALVGGPSHRSYLVDLGLAADRIALGYNAVDNGLYARLAARARADSRESLGLPERPFFLGVARFVREKNLERLIWAFARYRRDADPGTAWDLVLCGAGELDGQIEAAIRASGMGAAVHRPGFLQVDGLARWYAHASAFVLPSLSEPWGLVANEAAACGLPLLLSNRAGCSETLVPGGSSSSGRRFDPLDGESITTALAWMAGQSEHDRRAMGDRAAEIVAQWGPGRFAQGFREAMELARSAPRRRDASRQDPTPEEARA